MELLELYRQRLKRGQEIHSKKFIEIKEARQALKQRMPASSVTKLASNGTVSGNDSSGSKSAKKSKYMFPIYTAVAEKIKQDLTASPFRFQWEGNTPAGGDIKDAFDSIFLKVFTYDNSAQDISIGLNHAVVSGTMITQAVTKKEYRRRIKPDGVVDSIPIGRTIPIIAYDPLTTILDWNAKVGKVAETSEFIIVTLGTFYLDYVRKHWADKAEEVQALIASENIDNYKSTLEQEAGTSKSTYSDSVMLREYYTADGYRHVIANDRVLLETSVVSNGIMDRIPFDVAPIWDDPDSVYGMTLWNLLEPTIQVINTALNQILDSNALNAKMPFFTFKGTLKSAGLTLDSFAANEIVELDPKVLATFNVSGGSSKFAIQDMITKMQFPDITQAGVFLFETALKAIWFVTGLNPESLGGIQEKQIRNEMVAGMIQQSALRSSSKIVKNLELGFMNPTCWHLVDIFEMYYDDFPEFKEAGIPREFLKSLKEIRVVNGSYLPADKNTQMEKAIFLSNRAAMNQTYDQEKVEANLLKNAGEANPQKWFRPPEELIREQNAMRVLEEQDGQR